MTHQFKTRMQQAHQRGDYKALLELIPYARLIGVECTRLGDELLFRMPANKDNIGNPILPAIHGGVIAGFMELSAAFHLWVATEAPGVEKGLPKVVDFSLDYLRAGQFRDTYATCQVWRQGRRVANVAITAWQSTPAEPIATARAHFKIQEQGHP
ncbi:PaaI family thioesterase [Pseudomonas proteolytica]|uniref:PaaI family thioesterase n=1 Tax=Pseudomonas proteolytica TaxID=219574 RepID=UPI001473055B|nr:PaaI family thioesterase [Pseudomonas proteolytica]NMZ02395.1 PaaI family thioesterase [Pseudomonas proteolytica]